MIKKATLQELADYLGVSLSAVKQYNKKKRLLMLIGLKKLKEKRG
jgi:predicted transcriptional regulator